MKKLFFLILLSIPFVQSIGQSPLLDGLYFKKAVKKLEFEKVEYKIYNETVTSVRLTIKCKDKLSKSSVEDIYKLSQCFENIENGLEKSKNILTKYKYPLRSTVPMSIDGLESLVDIPQAEIYRKEAMKLEALYRNELKRLKKTGQLDSLVNVIERYGK